MNWITVDRANIIHNFLQHHNYYPGSLIIPVLKSNAYGHGLKQLCLILDKVPECTMVAVDSYPEYLSVYHNCKKDILLLNETEHKNYKYFDYKRTIPSVYTLDTLRVLIASKKSWRIHLFLNTWMNREWMQQTVLEQALELLKNSKIQVAWVMSHFSHADDDDWLPMCEQQIARFKQMYTMIENAWHKPRYRHINNSSGFVKNNDHRFNAHRIWKWLYGFFEYGNTSHATFGKTLHPALDVYSTVVVTQHIQSWEGVWYSHSWHADKECIIATIPFGYYEWLTRTMTNKRSVQRDWALCPMVWNISMNMSSFLDNTNTIKTWDHIKLISSNPADANSWQVMSTINNTISREVLVKIHPMIRRKVV